MHATDRADSAQLVAAVSDFVSRVYPVQVVLRHKEEAVSQNRPLNGTPWLWGVPCALVALGIAYLFGDSLVSFDAYNASSGGQESFVDIASRVAIPFIELGILIGVLVASLSYTRSPWRVLRNASFVLWPSAVLNILVFMFDHPLGI